MNENKKIENNQEEIDGHKKSRKNSTTFNTSITDLGLIQKINDFIGTRKITNKTQKNIEIIETFLFLIKNSKMELYRYFTKDESLILAKCIEGNFYYPNIQPKLFLKDLISNYKVFSLEDYSKINIVEGLDKKIEALSNFQCYTLIVSTYEYLESERNEKDLIASFLCIDSDIESNFGDK